MIEQNKLRKNKKNGNSNLFLKISVWKYAVKWKVTV